MKLLRMLNEELAAVAGRVQQGIVQVKNRGYGAGTGILVRQDGAIVTNAHVVRQRYPHVTLADGRTLRAQLVRYDTDLDLALLAVEAEALPALELGASEEARPGDLVLAVGHPWGVVGSATVGIIVGTSRPWLPVPGAHRPWIVADLHLRPGYSGGPLVDAGGRVVGVGTMVAGPDLGFAIPARVVRAFLEQAPVPCRA